MNLGLNRSSYLEVGTVGDGILVISCDIGGLSKGFAGNFPSLFGTYADR
jgi:hypothetical protein